MRNLLLPLVVALPLLACTPASDKAETGEAIAKGAGVGDQPTGRIGRPVARGATEGPIPADIDRGIDPAPNSIDSAAKSETASAPTTSRPTAIPALFHGRWGLTTADCKGDAAAKGLLTIDGSRLAFYESRAVLDRVDGWTAANRFTARYDFRGEGQEWKREVTLERSGLKLRRIESGGDEGAVDLTYTACPLR